MLWLSLTNENKDHGITDKLSITVAICHTSRKMAFYLMTSSLPQSLYIRFLLVCYFPRGEEKWAQWVKRKDWSDLLGVILTVELLWAFGEVPRKHGCTGPECFSLVSFPFLRSTSVIIMVGFDNQGLIPTSDIDSYSLLEYKLQILLRLNLTPVQICQAS